MKFWRLKGYPAAYSISTILKKKQKRSLFWTDSRRFPEIGDAHRGETKVFPSTTVPSSARWQRFIAISTTVFPNPQRPLHGNRTRQWERFFPPAVRASFFTSSPGSNRPTLWFVESDQSCALSKCQTNVKHATRASRSPCAVNRFDRPKESDLLNRCRLSGQRSLFEYHLIKNIYRINESNINRF